MGIVVFFPVLWQAVWEEDSGTDRKTDRHLAITRTRARMHTHIHAYTHTRTRTHTHTRNKSPLISHSWHIPWPVLPDAHVSSFCSPSSAHASLLACVLSAALSQWMLYGWLRSYWLHDPGWHLSYWPARWNIGTSLQPLMSVPQNIHTYTWTRKVLHVCVGYAISCHSAAT